MDYEKKYKEALGWMQSVYPTMTGADKEDAEHFFPELAESEDERIRKELLDFCKNRAEYYPNDPKYKNISAWIAWLEKQGEPNPYSGVSFKYNGHTCGMCARDNGVEILIDGHIKGRVFTNDSNAKEMFIKALERVEEQNSKGYKLTDCDKNSWWEDFKTYSGYIEIQKPTDKVEPKFKIGQIIKKDGFNTGFTIAKIEDDFYYNDKGDYFPFTDQDNWELIEKKFVAWSEENDDDAWLNDIISKAECNLQLNKDEIDFLKSLKDRVLPRSQWKPSDEQMSALSKAIAFVFDSNSDVKLSLESLYNELKKL